MNSYLIMKNYEAMSDVEINTLVYRASGGFSKALPDYCKDDRLSFKIILDNNISIINISGTTCWLACSRANFENVCMSPDGNDNGVSVFDAKHSVHHTNPRRAAMIVFLMDNGAI